VHEYPHDPRHGSYGAEAAQVLGVAPERVFKTLVAEVDGQLTIGVVPVAGQLDLKALAAAAGGKKAVLAAAAAAERATGYVTGGISPLGHRRRLPVVVDSSALGFGTVYCSAGRSGLDIELGLAERGRADGRLVGVIDTPGRRGIQPIGQPGFAAARPESGLTIRQDSSTAWKAPAGICLSSETRPSGHCGYALPWKNQLLPLSARISP
jgi:Cys-tRNA(Pro)/Cys-tRNA(Cys) deacylase